MRENNYFESKEYLIVGDVHITLESLDLSRMVLEKAYEQCKKRNIPAVFVGDLFHTKAIIRSECLNLALEYFRKVDWKVILIVGNHDYENNTCTKHSLECFKDLENVKVIDQMDWIGKNLFISYCSDEVFKKRIENTTGNILFCHHGISGFKMNNTKSYEGEVKSKDFKKFNKVICGHWHLPQEKGNIIYIGSPYQQNFGESGQIKRFLVVGEKGEIIEEINHNEFPKYIIMEVEAHRVLDSSHKLSIPIRDIDHVRLDIRGTKDQLSQINKSLVREKYNLECDLRINSFCEDSMEKGAEIEDTLNYTKMFEKWVDIKNTNLDKSKIIKKGMEYINAYL